MVVLTVTCKKIPQASWCFLFPRNKQLFLFFSQQAFHSMFFQTRYNSKRHEGFKYVRKWLLKDAIPQSVFKSLKLSQFGGEGIEQERTRLRRWQWWAWTLNSQGREGVSFSNVTTWGRDTKRIFTAPIINLHHSQLTTSDISILYYVDSSCHRLNSQTHSTEVQPIITRKHSRFAVTHWICSSTTHFDWDNLLGTFDPLSMQKGCTMSV